MESLFLEHITLKSTQYFRNLSLPERFMTHPVIPLTTSTWHWSNRSRIFSCSCQAGSLLLCSNMDSKRLDDWKTARDQKYSHVGEDVQYDQVSLELFFFFFFLPVSSETLGTACRFLVVGCPSSGCAYSPSSSSGWRNSRSRLERPRPRLLRRAHPAPPPLLSLSL